MNDLESFIKTTKESRELKRALAVKNTLAGRPWKDVADELGVCTSFIGKWRKQYRQHGIEGLKLAHKGSVALLPPEAKANVLTWLQEPERQNVSSLHEYALHQYGIEYRSRQS